MAFFSFRSAGRNDDEPAARANESDTVEGLRRRARHRLIGATVLVALGVVGFPLLFDTQPRPVAVDIPIEIPDKNKGAPVAVKPAAASNAAVATPSTPDPREPTVATGAAPEAGGSDPSDSKAAQQAANEATARPAPDNRSDGVKKQTAERAPEKPAERVADKPKDGGVVAAAPNKPDAPSAQVAPARSSQEQLRIAKAEEAARARALLQGKSEKEAEAAAQARFIVQIGAFSEPARAQATRSKVERAGLKTYTQETKTAGGTWIRVRVGPFATRAEADEAASKIKGLSLPASILGL
ncbi:MAG: SPOR domain-containing protein [Burkholderiales bacterium]